MSMRRYEAYKPSGVEWLGDVPSHWEVKSIKWLSPVLRGASPRPIDDAKYFDDDGEFAWVRIADVSASTGRLTDTTQRLSELGSSLSVKLQPGSLFVSIAGTVGKPCITEIRACIHDGFVFFPRLEVDPSFLFSIFEAGQCYAGLGKFGTQLNLNTDTIGGIRIAVPPPSEIAAILAFLDRETAKIDALVEEQKRLIDLLKEKRQALISHAVTKGLNPAAPMKSSGIEWLGDVPSHWEVTDLKRVITIATSGPRGWSDLAATDGEVFFQSQNIGRDMDFSFADAKRINPPEDAETERSLLKQDDVVICITGGRTGAVAHISSITEKAYINQHVCLIRPDELTIAGRFLGYTLFARPSQEQLGLASYGLKQGLGLDAVKAVLLGLPPLAEQCAIVHRLDEDEKRTMDMIGEAEAAIALLQERRAALISAAVTGKIDVRGLVPVEQDAA